MAKAVKKDKEVNKAGAPEGNTNAEVWTEELAAQYGNKVLNLIESDLKCRSIETACVKAGGYETLFDYLSNKYPIVFEPIKQKVKAIAKSRLMEQGLDGDVNATMAIFILKNNHDMKDKVETENRNYNADNPHLEDDKIKKLVDRL